MMLYFLPADKKKSILPQIELKFSLIRETPEIKEEEKPEFIEQVEKEIIPIDEDIILSEIRSSEEEVPVAAPLVKTSSELLTKDIDVTSSYTPDEKKQSLSDIKHIIQEPDINKIERVTEKSPDIEEFIPKSERTEIEDISIIETPEARKILRESTSEKREFKPSLTRTSTEIVSENQITRPAKITETNRNIFNSENLISSQNIEISRHNVDEQVNQTTYKSERTNIKNKISKSINANNTDTNQIVTRTAASIQENTYYKSDIQRMDILRSTHSITRSLIEPTNSNLSTEETVNINQFEENLITRHKITENILSQPETNVENHVRKNINPNAETNINNTEEIRKIQTSTEPERIAFQKENKPVETNYSQNITPKRKLVDRNEDRKLISGNTQIRSEINENYKNRIYIEENNNTSNPNVETARFQERKSAQPTAVFQKHTNNSQIETRQAISEDVRKYEDITFKKDISYQYQPENINIQQRETPVSGKPMREILNEDIIYNRNDNITRNNLLESNQTANEFSGVTQTEDKDVSRVQSNYKVQQAERRQSAIQEIDLYDFESERLSGFKFQDEKNVSVSGSSFRSGIEVNRQIRNHDEFEKEATSSYMFTKEMLDYIGKINQDDLPQNEVLHDNKENQYEGVGINHVIHSNRNIDGRYVVVEEERTMQHGLGRQSVGITADYSRLNLSPEYIESIERYSNLVIGKHISLLQSDLLPVLQNYYNNSEEELKLRVLLRIHSTGNIRSFSISESLTSNRNVRNQINNLLNTWDFQLPVEKSAQVYIWIFYQNGEYKDMNIYWNH